MNSIWLMTSAEYAGDTSLFVRIQNVLLRENGGIFILTSLGLIFLLGLLMAAVCQRIHLPRIIGMLLTGIILALCVGSAGCVNPEYLIGTAADRADHHFIKGRIIIGSEGSEKSGPLRSHAGLCSCHLRTVGFCDICTHDP